MQNAVSYAVKSAINDLKTSVVGKLIESNKTLQDTVTKQSETISKQNETIKTQQPLTDKQTNVIDSKVAPTVELEEEVEMLTEELDTVKLDLNDLGQYGRRNSLRFDNLKVNTAVGEQELTRAVVNFINDEILPDDDNGYTVSVSDVERCHPLGRPNRTGN